MNYENGLSVIWDKMASSKFSSFKMLYNFYYVFTV